MIHPQALHCIIVSIRGHIEIGVVPETGRLPISVHFDSPDTFYFIRDDLCALVKYLTARFMNRKIWGDATRYCGDEKLGVWREKGWVHGCPRGVGGRDWRFCLAPSRVFLSPRL